MGFDQAEIQADCFGVKGVCKAVFKDKEAGREVFGIVCWTWIPPGVNRRNKAAKNYHHDQPRDPELFRFEPIPLSFEPVEPGRCAPVLYSSAVRDMIDYCCEAAWNAA